MPSSLNGTGVTFNDATTLQSGNIPAANLGSGTANNTTFLRGDKTWQSPSGPPTIEIVNTQIFTASGTWTKPTGLDADDTLIVACIGGGGSGAAWRTSSSASAALGGAGGGGVALASVRLGDLPSTVSVTVGSGGAARTQTTNSAGSTSGLKGGVSIFGNIAFASGGNGGPFSDSTNFSAGTVGGYGVVFLGNAQQNNDAFGFEELDQKYGGRGRGGVSSFSETAINPGLTGGGGGAGRAGATERAQNYLASKDRLFGDGGDGGDQIASDGSAPGGGGGSAIGRTLNATSGAGARGEVQCFVVRGRISAPAFFGVV
jgi:hypothetical protein